MGWFGGGSSSNNTASSSSADFTSEDTSSFGGTNFAASAPSSGTSELEEFSVALQQQVLVQTVVTSMSDSAFTRCLQGKPGDNLNGREVACIHATVGKWLDTNEFMMGRMAKKEGAAAR
mmetsp:Transcript_18199/g.25890  ORF Transcript_18199/g.25890 Transcript_18199/m.25890 type:complete len:119 (+) Transcript_18199:133-489(+)|eukprot:CAMPEP_0172414900 /NCGR_PEP_ID=MMETSP1064-20121228/1502_1 /TAXON_ID=202472 /ORGANISM="Aulacoseira subarctica , Strain CCAP 1002/5" /LENGTH=118 /DNA_ID=CAMNT_0013151765 /DNA_START=131 /DNA_END=487 /DNA_ORIENTATION=+